MANNRVAVASIHNHFNLFRNIHDAHDGEVTIEEQIKAMERFVRWHERQVVVGKRLLARLEAEQNALATVS